MVLLSAFLHGHHAFASICVRPPWSLNHDWLRKALMDFTLPSICKLRTWDGWVGGTGHTKCIRLTKQHHAMRKMLTATWSLKFGAHRSFHSVLRLQKFPSLLVSKEWHNSINTINNNNCNCLFQLRFSCSSRALGPYLALCSSTCALESPFSESTL